MTTSNRPWTGLLILLALGVAATAAAQDGHLLVTNVHAEQRAENLLVDVTYDLQTVGDQPVFIILLFSTDGGQSFTHRCLAVSGDVGPGVLPGSGRHIVWDAGADLPGFSSTTCKVRVIADDSPFMADFVFVPPGDFAMGSHEDEPGRYADEVLHPVTISRGFFLSRYPVTEQVWDAVMGEGLSRSNLPKNNRSWDEAVAFCNALSLLEGLTPAYDISGPYGNTTWNRDADGYRLPTEAEWEYACRAGTQTAFASGPITYPFDCEPLDPYLDLIGWYCGNAGGQYHAVGLKAPNAWGLYDMHGLIYEWIWDGYRADYENLDPVDPAHDVGIGQSRVLRGGYRGSTPRICRSARRHSGGAGFPGSEYGFRVARSLIPAATGTIVVAPEPAELDAPWQLSGPSGFTAAGSGEAVLPVLAAGSYTVTWGGVPGWETPASETQTLTAGAVLTFHGLYAETPPDAGFVLIPPGSFIMGSPDDEPGRWGWEGPQHQVTLTRGFYLAVHEVTEELWYQVMGGTPTTSQLPKGDVSWDQAVAFCNALSLLAGLIPAYTIHGPDGDVTWDRDADGYRLPTEAEWEYACRAGALAAYHNDTNCLSSDDEANFRGDADQLPGCPTGIFRGVRTDVGSFPANPWGAYDMHGNQWEWVWCGWRHFTGAPLVDPATDAVAGADRLRRGGGYEDRAGGVRAAMRYHTLPSATYISFGVRVARTAF